MTDPTNFPGGAGGLGVRRERARVRLPRLRLPVGPGSDQVAGGDGQVVA